MIKSGDELVREVRTAYSILIGKPEIKRSCERLS
jgi:hypothetical protein